MAAESLKTVSTRLGRAATPQTKKAAPGQKKNHSGGFTFVIDDMERAKRFLILGAESSFYRSGEKLAAESAKVIIKLAEGSEQSSMALVQLIVDVSAGGRAPKQSPGLFALAIAASHGDTESKKYALHVLPQVARTAGALFEFVGYVEQFRGWGRALKAGIAAWYENKSLDALAYQTLKYRKRGELDHKILLERSHAFKEDEGFKNLRSYLRGYSVEELGGGVPEIVKGFEMAKGAPEDVLPGIIREYGLSWEMLPTEALNEPGVWDALLDGNVPLGALLRQLPRLTRIGVIKPTGGRTAEIVARLTDAVALKKARIHPMAMLIAGRTYASGKSDKGSSSWTPNQKIVAALDKGFYEAYGAVEPTGKRIMQALDISDSMTWHQIGGLNITPREASAAIAMVTEAVEAESFVMGFTYTGSYYRGGVTHLEINSRMSLNEVDRVIRSKAAGATDCAAPIMYALENDIAVDAFVIYTDNETNSGEIHPFEALKKYRAKTGIDAKLIVVAMEVSKFSIADPRDPNMLDIAGFDTAVPSVISAFIKGV